MTAPPGCYELRHGGWLVLNADGRVALVERYLVTHSCMVPTPAADLIANLRGLADDIEAAAGPPKPLCTCVPGIKCPHCNALDLSA